MTVIGEMPIASLTPMPRLAISRRQLLRCDLRGERAALRPPWALAEPSFLAACDRCGDCTAACPESLIRPGSGGFPELSFAAGGCSFCGDCLAACAGKALRGDPELDRPWDLVARIGAACLVGAGILCRSCGDACEAGAIRFRPRVGAAAAPLLDRERCTGCGTCVGVCPVQAVQVLVPDRPPVALG